MRLKHTQLFPSISIYSIIFTAVSQTSAAANYSIFSEIMYKIAELNTGTGKRRDIASAVFLSQPDANKEKVAGRLFGLLEIQPADSLSPALLEMIWQNLKNNYYQNEKIFLLERLSTLKVDHIFEAATAKTNKDFGAYLQEKKIRFNYQNLRATIGVLHNDYLYFANTGTNKLLLWSPHRAGQGRQLINLNKPVAEESGPEGEKKIFYYSLAGKIPDNSFLLLANEALLEYLSENQLEQIITALPPASAVAQIKNLLANVNSYVPFNALLVKKTALMESAPISTPATADNSLAKLRRTEKNTDKFLSPSGLFSGQKIESWWKKIWPSVRGRQTSSPPALVLKERIILKKRPWFGHVAAGFRQSARLAANLFFRLLSLGTLLWRAARVSAWPAGIKKIPAGTIALIRSLAAFLRVLRKPYKIALAVLALVIIFLGQNIWLMRQKNNELQKQEEFLTLSGQIEQKQNQADASLLYNNDEGAMKLFAEIDSLLQALPAGLPETEKKREEFTRKYNEQLEKLRRVVRLKEEKKIIDLKEKMPSAAPDNLVFIGPAGKLIAADTAANTLHVIDPEKQSSLTAAGGEPFGSYGLRADNRQNLAFYFFNSQILELNTSDNQISLAPIKINRPAAEFTGLAEYNGRLYLLNPAAGQIYRHNRLSKGYDEGTGWLEEKNDLSKAVDIGIDGHIYLLKQDGQIIKLLRGRTSDFKQGLVDPPIQAAVRLIVSADQPYLYVFEPSAFRLIVYDKDGEFLTQYTLDQFTDLKDVALDEKGKNLYVLNGTAVYGLKLEHIK